jgi:hypothetical protein
VDILRHSPDTLLIRVLGDDDNAGAIQRRP